MNSSSVEIKVHWIKAVISLWKCVYSLKMSSFRVLKLLGISLLLKMPPPPSLIQRKSERCSSKCIISVLQITDPLFLNEFFHAGAFFPFTFLLLSSPLLAFLILCFIIFQPRHPRPLCACDLPPLISFRHVSASYLLFFPPVSEVIITESDRRRLTSMLLWNNFIFLVHKSDKHYHKTGI